VPAEDKHWQHPPFAAINDGGIIFGRGALDTKQLSAMEMMVMLLLKREKVPLSGPVILLATADEENGSVYGMQYISEKYPELLPEGYVISEGGGFVLSQGGKNYRTCTCGEKGQLKMALMVNKEANSSSLDPNNSAQGQLLEFMLRLSEYEAPEELRGPTRRFLEAAPQPHSDPALHNLWEYSSKSCLSVDGCEINFEPGTDKVELKLNYQFLPGTPQPETEALMDKLIHGLPASYKAESRSEGYECDMDNPFFKKLEEVSIKHDAETSILPIFALGRTDGRFIRRNVYGYSPLLKDMPFSQVLKKVHQADECISEASLCFGGQVLYETVRGIADGKQGGLNL
jgi:acetylornithine deacetylase/succinyl-diaminopimelate desuccinylase-like protein